MEYAIATDLDGTLLGTNGELSEYTKEVVLRLIDAGVTIIPCTARSVSDLPKSLLDLDIRYFACTNGSVIYDKEKDEVVESFLLSKELAFNILDRLDLNNVFVNLIYDGDVYSEHRLYDAYADAGIYSREIAEKMRQGRKSIDSSYEFLKSLEALDKLHMNFLNVEDRDKTKAIIGESDEYLVQHSDDLNLEITNSKSDKGVAARYIYNLLGLQGKELIGFGDNYNDIPLFNAADIKVKMKNGIEELKAYTNYETPEYNDKDGVALFLEKFIFGNDNN